VTPALVLVWLGTAGERAVRQSDLDAWAASRGVALEDPNPARPLDPAGHDDALAKQIEALLAEARTASFSADADSATKALDLAVSLLRANASLPESPWLMAEAWRVRADLVRSTEPDVAADLERRAAAIDGVLALPFGGEPAPRRPNGPRPAPRFPATTSPTPAPAPAPEAVRLEGPLATDEVEIDGTRVVHPPTSTRGAHHVRVLRRGRLAYAGWMDLGSDAAVVALPSTEPCSDEDLGEVRAEGRLVHAGGVVACPRYAVARATTGGVEVSLCGGTRCGPFLPWSRGWGKDYEGPAHPPWPEPRNKDWILWTALGVVGVVAGGIVLYRSGAFETQGQTHETFTFVPPAR
jgi:hypothetical protein